LNQFQGEYFMKQKLRRQKLTCSLCVNPIWIRTCRKNEHQLEKEMENYLENIIVQCEHLSTRVCCYSGAAHVGKCYLGNKCSCGFIVHV
jgi:hypothetical protein